MTKNKPDYPDCYECKWRGDVPGSAHSMCRHPKNKLDLDNNLSSSLAALASVRRVKPIKSHGLKIKANIRGIIGGWFNYPWNFDPVWLEECDGFENVEESENK